MLIWIKDKNGFSLLEILITTIIIGLIASLAFVNYDYIIEGSRSKEGVYLLYGLYAAQKRYLSENNGYADSLSKLGISIPNNGNFSFYQMVFPPIITQAKTVAAVKRNSSSAYVLAIDIDGKIYCGFEQDAKAYCTRLGYKPFPSGTGPLPPFPVP